MSAIHFNTQNPHPLIPRDQTYVLDRKLVTIHSEDRDIKKYPDANRFEVKLPNIMENVASMRLVECSFPSAYYTFSNEYQNTKLTFSINPICPCSPYFTELNSLPPNKRQITIQIQDGFYCPQELATEIQEKLNEAAGFKIKQILADQGINVDVEYCSFRVHYDKVGQGFFFGNQTDGFTIHSNKKEEYPPPRCDQPVMWDKNINWGLSYHLGFEKNIYTSLPVPENSCLKFHYLGTAGVWLTKPTNSDTLPHYVRAPNRPDILGERAIYMEINKYNSYDELVPGPLMTNSSHNNTYGGIVDSAFAKIPITTAPVGEFQDSRNGFLQNITTFDVPEEKISKLELLFRYHDGRLVDFGISRFNFSIEFNCLKNEIGRAYNVRVPFTYNM